MRNVSLMLLPGLDGTGDMFDPLLKALPDNIKPVVVSYSKDKPLGYEELKPLVMASLPKDTDYFILGESFSGPLAVMIAADKPEGLKGIILCATFIKKPFRVLPSWLSNLSISPVYHLWPLTIRLRALFSGGKYSDLFEMALKAVRSVKPDVIAERVRSIFKVDVEEELKLCPVPVLYLTSTKDHLIKEHNIRYIKKVKNDVQEVRMDTLHFILQLEPVRSAEAITGFMEKCVGNEKT